MSFTLTYLSTACISKTHWTLSQSIAFLQNIKTRKSISAYQGMLVFCTGRFYFSKTNGASDPKILQVRVFYYDFSIFSIRASKIIFYYLKSHRIHMSLQELHSHRLSATDQSHFSSIRHVLLSSFRESLRSK